MNFKHFRWIAVACVTAFPCVNAELSDEELLSRVEIAVKAAYDNLTGEGGIPEALELFKDQTDAERTKALFLYMLSFEDDSPMNAQTSVGAGTLLRTEPSFIRDKTTLKQMLATEQNARKFFLLANLTATFQTTKGDDFIPSFWHMLFRDDPVAIPAREYDPPFIHNVSIYSYEKITGMLSLMDADFEPPQDKMMPYEERVLILAKWLQANWPGCEDLEIPATVNRPEKNAPDETVQAVTSRKEKARDKVPLGSSDKNKNADKNSWKWISASFVLIALLLFALIRFLRG